MRFPGGGRGNVPVIDEGKTCSWLTLSLLHDLRLPACLLAGFPCGSFINVFIISANKMEQRIVGFYEFVYFAETGNSILK